MFKLYLTRYLNQPIKQSYAFHNWTYGLIIITTISLIVALLTYNLLNQCILTNVFLDSKSPPVSPYKNCQLTSLSTLPTLDSSNIALIGDKDNYIYFDMRDVKQYDNNSCLLIPWWDGVDKILCSIRQPRLRKLFLKFEFTKFNLDCLNDNDDRYDGLLTGRFIDETMDVQKTDVYDLGKQYLIIIDYVAYLTQTPTDLNDFCLKSNQTQVHYDSVIPIDKQLVEFHSNVIRTCLMNKYGIQSYYDYNTIGTFYCQLDVCTESSIIFSSVLTYNIYLIGVLKIIINNLKCFRLNDNQNSMSEALVMDNN
jgi:hypothetical protein